MSSSVNPPPPAALVSVVVVVKDQLALARACVESIGRHTPGAVELVLVDNGSSQVVAGLADQIGAAGRRLVYVRNARDEGLAYAYNQGIAAAHGAYLVILSHDVVVTPDWLWRQIALLDSDPALALVGPMTNATRGAQLVGIAPNGAGAGVDGGVELDRFARRWALDHADERAIVPGIVGRCMVMRRALVEEIGGFDTAPGLGGCEDDDFCVRVVRAGHQIAVAADVFVQHRASASAGPVDPAAPAPAEDDGWRFLCQKWDHAPADRTLAALAALGRGAPFDRARDRIPVSYPEIFHPGVDPLPLPTRAPARVLCIPDPGALRAADGPARAVLGRFVATLTAQDPVALVIRVEPPTPDGAVEASQAMQDLLRERGIRPEDAPEIFVDATPLAPARRGSLYTAAAAFLCCGGAHEAIYRREALGAGLTLIEPVAEIPGDPARARPAAAPVAASRPPLVSVIIPTFNRQRLLEVALRSVLAQTLDDLEIIVVNDAGPSVAATVEGLNGSGRIRVLDNPRNLGPGGSRNAALRVARGHYIAYLDDDDVFHPDHLATLAGALADGAHQVAYSDPRRAKVRADGVVVGYDVPYSTDFDADAILLTNFIPNLFVMHQRACFEALAGAGGDFFDQSLPVLEDWEIWIRLSRRFRFIHVPRVTCTFTVRTDGSSLTTERIRSFETTEQVIRRRYRRQIASAPRAMHALYQSLVPVHRALVGRGQAVQAAAELAAFLESFPECREARADLAAIVEGLAGASG